MVSKEEQLKAFAVKLHEIDALKFGDYKLKSGRWSPVYFDLRVIISYPDVMVSSFLSFHQVSHLNVSSLFSRNCSQSCY